MAEEELVLKGTWTRFWGILVPAYLASSAILLRFSFWGLKVFFPKVDMPLRIFAGYVPPAVVLINLVFMIAVYWKYLGMSFEFTPNSLVFKQHGKRVELPWEDIKIYEKSRIAVISARRKRVVVHQFFFDDIPRLCELAREAHRYKRKDWGAGPK